MHSRNRMSEITADCPRCHYAKITFDVLACVLIAEWGWQGIYEIFCVCRHCNRGTIFQTKDKDPETAHRARRIDLVGIKKVLNEFLDISGYVSAKDRDAEDAPAHIPENIKKYFDEGAQCMAIGCFNAGGTMFRLCLDAATKKILEDLDKTEEIPKKVVYSLGFRLEWLLAKGHLDKGLADLAECVKEDGNDGAHEGTLTQADAEDLRDFTVELLERLYTEPARLEEAKERRKARRTVSD
jgi:hypothetical protein